MCTDMAAAARVCVHVHMCMYVYMCACVCTCVYMCVCVRVRICVRVCVCMCVYVCARVCVCTWQRALHSRTGTFVGSGWQCPQPRVLCSPVCQPDYLQVALSRDFTLYFVLSRYFSFS